MFVLSIILAIIGLSALIGGLIYARRGTHRVKNPDRRASYDLEYITETGGSKVPALIGAGITALALVALLISSLTAVPAQNVGVVTSFGKPVGAPLHSGLHLKAPWHKVTDMDGTIQQENNFWGAADPNNKDATVDGRTKIRLNSTNGEMFVNNQLRWRIKQPAAGRLFADWKTFDKIGPGLVQKQLSGALNDVLASYDPLTVGAKNLTNDQIAAQTATKLQERLGDDIEVIGLTVTTIDFDDATQARINDFQAEVARTRVAEQRKLTVAAEKSANDQLASSVDNPNVIVSKCEDTHRSMVEKGQTLTGVPSCWPGGTNPVQTLPVK